MTGPRAAARAPSIAVGALVFLAAACRGKDDSAPEAPPAVDVSPVPAPADLLATVTIATPDATWQRLQRGIGGAAGILPSTLGGIVCSATGLDPSVALEIDGTSAAFVVVSGRVDAPSWALAARLADARRVRASLEGETSHFDVHQDATNGLEVALPALTKGRVASSRQPAIAVTTSGWLVIANAEPVLGALAPYATRTMPVNAAAAKKARDATVPDESVAIDIPRAALAGALADRVSAEWASTKAQMSANDRALRDAHGGRAPDFGDPAAIVAVMDSAMQGRLAVLADLAGAHVGITVADAEVHVMATAKAASPAGAASKAIAGIASGDLAPLLALTGDAAAAVFVRDSGASAAQTPADFEAAFGAALGPRLGLDGAKRIHEALGDWSRAKGEAWTAAIVSRGSYLGQDSGVVVDAQATDPKLAARAVREALDSAAKVPALREPLTTWLGVKDVTFGAVDVAGGGRASLASFVRDAPPHLALAWLAGATDVKLALGAAPGPLLAAPAAGHTLGDDPVMRAALSATAPAAGALVVQPSRAGCDGAGGVVFAWGRRDAAGAPAMWTSLAATDAALRCLAKAAL